MEIQKTLHLNFMQHHLTKQKYVCNLAFSISWHHGDQVHMNYL